MLQNVTFPGYTNTKFISLWTNILCDSVYLQQQQQQQQQQQKQLQRHYTFTVGRIWVRTWFRLWLTQQAIIMHGLEKSTLILLDSYEGERQKSQPLW